MGQKSFISGLIMEGSKFEGKLEFKEKMRIDGEFIGEISSKDQLIVGKTAKLDAVISVGEMIVMGEVRGKVAHCDSLQILEGGSIIGDITVKTLEIKPGGLFEGNCAMMTGSSQNQNKQKS